MNNLLNEYFRFNFELNIELNHFLARFNVKMNNQNVSATPRQRRSAPCTVSHQPGLCLLIFASVGTQAKFQGEIRGQPCDASATVILTLISLPTLISEPRFCFLGGFTNSSL